MKRLLACAVLTLIFFAGCSKKEDQAVISSGTAVDFSDDAGMRRAAAEIAASIDNQFGAGTKIALVNIASADHRANSVLNDMTAYLAKSGKLGVVDGERIDSAGKELNLNRNASSGLPDISLLELGRLLGAQLVLTGDMTAEKGAYRIVVRVLDTQTSFIAGQYQANVPVGKPAKL